MVSTKRTQTALLRQAPPPRVRFGGESEQIERRSFPCTVWSHTPDDDTPREDSMLESRRHRTRTPKPTNVQCHAVWAHG